MCFGISEMVKKDGAPKVVLINITRQGSVSYNGLEAVKDGIFFSSKYESGMCMFNSPHVIVFSNEEPEYENLTKDRWNVIDLSGGCPPSPATNQPLRGEDELDWPM